MSFFAYVSMATFPKTVTIVTVPNYPHYVYIIMVSMLPGITSIN